MGAKDGHGGLGVGVVGKGVKGLGWVRGYWN